VTATLDRASAETQDDGTATAPVLIRVRERSPHRIAFGAGASSNTGARVEFNYHTPDLFNQAWELNSGLRLEQKKQTAYADVFLPPDERNRRHSVGVMAEATDIQGLKTERYAFGAQTVQQRGSVEQRLSLNWQDERRYPDGASAVTSRALVPNAMWTWRQVDSRLDPRRGIVLQGQVGGGARATLSDQNFVRLHGRAQLYLPLGKTDTLTLRGEAGYTLADSRQHIPQDYLFRTGGAGTVRGYAYQSLGIKEGTATVGGRYLAIASAEFTHWLDDDWGVAAFVDAGDAVDSLTAVRLAVGYGLGARWRSPAGPIGVDLAYGQRNHEVHLHFSLAIPF
jgi:translocation and assembly module TamA